MAALSVLLLFGALLAQTSSVAMDKSLFGSINETLVVTAVLEEPFLMKVNDKTAKGNDRYRGFLKDLLDNMSRRMGFMYTLRVRDDFSFKGMIDDLVNKTADLAAGSMTITFEREKLIDMSKPFMNSGITIMMKKTDVIVEVAPPIDTSVVMKPFKPAVWICILLSIFVTTGVFYIINRFDPNEKAPGATEKKKRDEDEEEEDEEKKDTDEELNFSIIACLWMVLGGLVGQSYTKRPQSIAALVLFFVWWVFCIVIFAFYIGGILRSGIYESTKVKVAQFESFDDLITQHDIKFGAVSMGSTYNFFKASNLQKYQVAAKMMRDDPSRMVASHMEGYNRVRKGGYAMLAEFPFVRYMATKKPCDVMQVGGYLNRVGYGFGLQKNSSFTPLISKAVLLLSEDQTLFSLQNRWWFSECSTVKPKTAGEGPKFVPPARPLSMGSIGGIFIIYFVGLIFTLITMLIEVVLHKRKLENEKKAPHEPTLQEQASA